MHARVSYCDDFSESTNHIAPAIHHDFVNNVCPFIS
jgi:hypothetical protein